MRVFNRDKTQELFEYDLERGLLLNDVLIIHHDAIQHVEEEGHYEVVAEYPNGGKDIEWVIDKPGVEGRDAYDEYEDIQLYVPFTDEEYRIRLIQNRINDLKNELYLTDYKAIKYSEGVYTDEEYQPVKEERQKLRDEIRKLEKELEDIN